MGLMFEVAEGGFLDIDVRIEGKHQNEDTFVKKMLRNPLLQAQMVGQCTLGSEKAMENIRSLPIWRVCTSTVFPIR